VDWSDAQPLGIEVCLELDKNSPFEVNERPWRGGLNSSRSKAGSICTVPVDSQGNTLRLLLRAKRDAQAAERFCGKRPMLHTQREGTNVDKMPCILPPLLNWKPMNNSPKRLSYGRVGHLNNWVEARPLLHQATYKPGMGFACSTKARRTLRGMEAGTWSV